MTKDCTWNLDWLLASSSWDWSMTVTQFRRSVINWGRIGMTGVRASMGSSVSWNHWKLLRWSMLIWKKIVEFFLEWPTFIKNIILKLHYFLSNNNKKPSINDVTYFKVQLKYSGDLNTRLVCIQMVKSCPITEWFIIGMPLEYRTKFSLVFRPPFEYRTSE